jgi:hypothetical protein
MRLAWNDRSNDCIQLYATENVYVVVSSRIKGFSHHLRQSRNWIETENDNRKISFLLDAKGDRESLSFTSLLLLIQTYLETSRGALLAMFDHTTVARTTVKSTITVGVMMEK